MLVEDTFFGIQDKVQIAIDRLRGFEPPEGYCFEDSGGKDSTDATYKSADPCQKE